MKANKYILLAAMALGLLTACENNKLSEVSVFEDVPVLDSTSYTFEFDDYLYHAYLLDYNIDFQYKLKDEGTDMEYNLVPVEYEKAKMVAHVVKYLWIDVYAKQVSKDFLRTYTPRIIMLVGSPAVNAAQGTWVLGTADNGIKITLYNMNAIDLNDAKWLNTFIFHVMHHEFSHIMHQNKSFPKEYEQISAGLYDSQSWQYYEDTTAYQKGFATPYSMSEAHEDFVEIISSYITDTRDVWADRGFTMAEDHTHIVEYDSISEGATIINTKITMCKDWLLEKYGFHLDSIRAEVQRRQDAMTEEIVMNDLYEK